MKDLVFFECPFKSFNVNMPFVVGSIPTEFADVLYKFRLLVIAAVYSVICQTETFYVICWPWSM